MTRSTSKSSNTTDNTFPPLAVPELEVELVLQVEFEAEPVNKLELEPTEVPELQFDLS
jgi:hypothetical protein